MSTADELAAAIRPPVTPAAGAPPPVAAKSPLTPGVITAVSGAWPNQLFSVTIGGAPTASTNRRALSSYVSGAIGDNVWLLPVGTIDGPDWLIIGAIQASPAANPGDVKWGGWTTAPPGWVLCDGTQYNTTGTTAALFAAIGYTYGGSGAVFRVPDLRGKVPVTSGAGVAVGGGALTTRSLGQAGGDEQMQQHDHANTTGESANHTHTVPVGTFGQISNYGNEVSGGLGGSGSVLGPSGRGTPATSIDSNGHVHGTAVSGTGTAGNMPPFLVLNSAIKL